MSDKQSAARAYVPGGQHPNISSCVERGGMEPAGVRGNSAACSTVTAARSHSCEASRSKSWWSFCACGGGGGDSSTSSSTSGSSSSSGGSPSQTVTGTLSTPQYTSGSAQITAFNLLNQYRAQCGIPALQENTVLDQAAQSHAKYMGLNSAISDSETSGSAGFTGASYQDRAVAAGLPTSTFSTGVSGGASITTNGFTAAQAGQMFVNSLLAGVYHAAIVAYPSNTMGIGEYETQSTSSGLAWTNAWESISVLVSQSSIFSNTPLTFPCQGVTGVPYKSTSESPTPPNVSNSGWGTPVVVMGNT
ncbi:hypothetical protein BJ085DRAFT_37320, partial [Dimargaris cristalligena]